MTEQITNPTEKPVIQHARLKTYKKPPGTPSVYFKRGDPGLTMVELMIEAMRGVYVGAPEPIIAETAVDYWARISALNLPLSYDFEPKPASEPSQQPLMENFNEMEE